jgi:hypothetical protein
MGSGIVEALVPPFTFDDCVKQVLECKGEPSSESGSGDLDVVFPNFLGSVLPLAGGSIVRFDIKSWKFESSDSSNDLIGQRLADISGFPLSNNLESLNQFRLFMNRELFKLQELKIVEAGTETNPPNLFLSYLQGSDAAIDETKSSPSITRICKFKYIPPQLFNIALSKVVPDEESEGDFGNTIGVSGKTFRELLKASEMPSEKDIIDLALEFFTIFNISEDEIVKRRGSPTEGGYYTILNRFIYIKMPDLTGRDSAGFYSDIFDDDSNLYIEISKERKRYGRSKFPIIGLPILATVDDSLIPLDDSQDVEITIDTATDAGDIVNAYLSIIAKGEPAESSSKSVKFFKDSLEVFSIPMLTINDYFTGRKGTVEYDIKDKLNAISFYIKPEEATIDAGKKEESAEEIGIPFIGGEFKAEYFFGEKNRPDIVLADPNSPKSVNKNDRRYFSPKSYGAIPIFSGVRPRLTKTVPSKWIKMSRAVNGNEDEKVTLIFNKKDFDTVNFDALGNSASFALYVEDKYGQILKVAGENVTIATGLPIISSVSPNGYKGSSQILSTSTKTILRFSGEGLSNAVGINVSLKGTDIGNNYPFSDEFLEYSGSPTLSTLTINTSTSYIGLEPGQEYDISLISLSGEKGKKASLYINTADNDEQISKSKEIVKFKSDEFYVKGFKSGYISEIPILTDSDAVLQLKSKQKLFDGDLDIFAYIAVKNKDVAIAIGGDDVMSTTIFGETLYIPYNLEYNFSMSPSADFGRQFFNSRANLSIPGNTYRNYNLFPLLNAPIGSAIVFYNKKITDYANGKVVSSNDGDFAITFLGTSDGRKPFVLGPTILDLIVELPGDTKYISTSVIEESDTGIKESFSELTISVGTINVFQKVTRLGIIFSGSEGSNLRKQYKFYIGKTKLPNPSEKIKDLGGGRFLAVFTNVNIKEEGVLELRVEKKDKKFKYKSTGRLSRRASFLIEDFSYEQEDGILTVNNGSATFYSDGIVDVNEKPVDLLIYGKKSGIILNDLLTTETTYSFSNPLTIRPNVAVSLSYDGSDRLIAGAPNELSEISKLPLLIPPGEIMRSRSFSISDSGTAIGYMNWDFSNAVTLKCNIPQVEIIYPTVSAADGLGTDTINGSLLRAGSEIKVRVTNTKKNFKIIFNGLFAAKTKGPPRKISRGVYEATITVPSAVVGFDCIDLCVSMANSRRLGAKLAMGEKFVRNIGQNMSDKLTGFMKDKIPDSDDLKRLIEKFPLRFLNIKLDKSLIPIDLINSFCDFSWHLAADLKLALNGFQTLLIPIQVILCIIDVICSLLHPAKLATAVIRLFYCLYDLLLLLPQISIPVMLLNLILHLLQLLECVILKVIEIITAINDIIRAIEIARQQELWDALITLEEVLSQYLFELNVDLDILEPIISILAIFLEILQLIFNFPCPPDDGIGDKSCGLQGAMIAGIVAGKISPGDGVYDPSVLLPIAQYYTNDEIEDMISSNSGSSYEEYSLGDQIVSIGTNNNFFDSMNIDPNSLRTKNGIDFEASFAASFTKSTKGLGEPTVIKFKFKDKLDNSGFFKKRVLDPVLNRDHPFHLFDNEFGTLKISAGRGNFISPIDGASFIDIDGDRGTVKKLTLTFELPIMEPNPETGLLEEIGIEEVTRTFDDIPKMAIVDEEANLYFIEPDGIEFNSDNDIEEITARIINQVAAPKFRFTRDDQEVDTDDDDINDDEGRVFDLPQLFFVDMRSIADELQSACYAASYNEFLLEQEETGDTDDIAEIVQDSSDCVEKYRGVIKGMIANTRATLEAGNLPELLDIGSVMIAHQEMIDCLNNSVNKICRFVVNPLNTSFLIEDDVDYTPLEEFPDDVFDPAESRSFQVTQDGPAFTGAREYAGGIGDSHVIGIGQVATIRLTPRDSYDLEMPGDLSNKISINIISDTTGSAEFVKNEDGTIIENNGVDYYIRIRSNAAGVVKITASVCGRTIAAVTYAGINNQTDSDSTDCIPDSPAPSEQESPTRPGALLKVDRVLSLYYVKLAKTAEVKPDYDGNAVTSPQAFGTSLEN